MHWFPLEFFYLFVFKAGLKLILVILGCSFSCHILLLLLLLLLFREKCVSVTTAWRVLRLRIEERPPIRRVAANILNRQSRTAKKGWSSMGEELTAPQSNKVSCYEMFIE